MVSRQDPPVQAGPRPALPIDLLTRALERTTPVTTKTRRPADILTNPSPDPADLPLYEATTAATGTIPAQTDAGTEWAPSDPEAGAQVPAPADGLLHLDLVVGDPSSGVPMARLSMDATPALINDTLASLGMSLVEQAG